MMITMGEFLDYSKKRIIQTVFELDGNESAKILRRYAPFCYTTLEENGITITLCNSLSMAKQKESLGHISYQGIESVQLFVTKKIGVVFSLPSVVLYLNVIINLNSGEHIHFECDELELIPKLISLFGKENIVVHDPFNLSTIMNEKMSIEQVHEYLRKNLDELSKGNDIPVWRMNLVK
ncbi:hypothetical protein [Bacillus massiliigorillae]|uniref:hypothetical protein n=1 Tax=Bacillus massiliigorillae TaxID=1243664 RepID=UPI00039FF0C9|nr:hypothetical protein [Bacillus massiliigorillae]